MVSYNILYMSGVLNSMPSLTGTMDKVKGLLFNKKFLIIMVVVVIFLAVAFYVYNTYVAQLLSIIIICCITHRFVWVILTDRHKSITVNGISIKDIISSTR